MSNIMNRFNILAKLLLITAVSVLLPAPTIEFSVREVFNKFKFRKRSGLLQFWACTPSDTEDGGYKLMLTDQFFIMSTPDEGLLQDYRNKCLKKCVENRYPVVGVQTNVGNWLAGRAAQTRIADHRTKHHMLIQEDQHSADVGSKGQLVLPVFNHQRVLVGIIEFVTPVPKKSYLEDFEQLNNLLEDEGLKSKYMGKTIKVGHNDDLLKFRLPLSATRADLHRKVKKRFEESKQDQKFCVEYEDTQGNHHSISSNEELRDCMEESSSKGAKFIRMRVLLNT